jgi:RNA polymerase sigma-70 factor, ECF subfamily
MVMYRQRLRDLAAAALPSEVACRADASDMVQQTFADANESFAAFRGSSLPELFTWLAAILNNNVTDAVRQHVIAERRSVKAECQFDNSSHARAKWNLCVADQTPPSMVVDRSEAHKQLQTALECLPARQRMAVSMRHLEGRPLDDIAVELKCTRQAAAAVIARGLRGMRAALVDMD